MSKLKPLSLFWEISWEKTNSRDFSKLAPVKVYYFSWRWKKKKSLLCCWVLQYTERVRVPSGNVSGTNFPLQNVPQMFRQMWGTLVPSESVWVSKSVSWMFLTLINLPCQAQKCLRWAVIATNGQKSTATFCAWGLFHFLGFQTSCFHMTLPVSIHILQIRFPPFCFTAWKEICSRFFP